MLTAKSRLRPIQLQTLMMFEKLKNAKKFRKLDLTSTYWQTELEEKAKILSIINTNKGPYKVKWLEISIKNSFAIFQQTIESILSFPKGILIYQDDDLIFTENEESLTKRLNFIRTRLCEKRVTIKRNLSNIWTKSHFLGSKSQWLAFALVIG